MTPETPEVPDETVKSPFSSEDEVIAFTQNRRKQIVDAIMPGGVVPEDNKARMALLKTLDGLDSSALANKKIKADQQIAISQERTAETIASILSEITSPNQLRSTGVPGSQGPALPDSLGTADVIPGELEIGVRTESHENFLKRTSLPDQ